MCLRQAPDLALHVADGALRDEVASGLAIVFDCARHLNAANEGAQSELHMSYELKRTW